MGKDAIRTTVVGGRAPKDNSIVYTIPNNGIERVLKAAAGDSIFRDDLFARRSVAAIEYGIELSETDSETINGVSENQLRSIVKAIVNRYRHAITTVIEKRL